VPSAPSLGATTAVTLDAWINPATVNFASGAGTVVAKSNYPARNYGLYVLSGGVLHLSYVNSSGVNVYLSTAAGVITAGTWANVAGVIDVANGVMQIYVNGKLIASRQTSGPMAPNNTPLTIGSSDGTSLFSGQIDEVLVYTSALSAAQVQALARAPSSTSTLPAVAGLVSSYTAGPGAVTARAAQNVYLTAAGNLNLGAVFAPGVAGLTATGSILDGVGDSNVRLNAGSLVAQAGDSVGSAQQPLSTQVSSAGTLGGASANNVFVQNQGNLTVNGLSAANGQLSLTNDGNLTVTGNLTLETYGAGVTSDNVHLTNNARVSSAAGSVAFQAGGGIATDAGTTISTNLANPAAAISLSGGGENKPGAPGVPLTINGALIGNNVTLDGAANDFNDLIDLAVGGAAPNDATAGQPVNYTFTVTNNSTEPAAGVKLTDVLPVTSAFVSAPAPQGWTVTAPAVGQSGTIVFTDSAVLAPGASVMFTVNTTAATTGTTSLVLTDTATVSFAGADSQPGNNSVTFRTTWSPGTRAGVDIHGQPTDVPAGQVLAPITVAVVDGYGNTITTESGTPVTLSIASGPKGARLLGTTTVQAVNGVATFSDLMLTQVGAYVLTTTSDQLTPDDSNPFQVLPAAVTASAQERAVRAVYLEALGRPGSESELGAWAADCPKGRRRSARPWRRASKTAARHATISSRVGTAPTWAGRPTGPRSRGS
jgi:uncharacterized repeat protein (TIGR01451 family)